MYIYTHCSIKRFFVVVFHISASYKIFPTILLVNLMKYCNRLIKCSAHAKNYLWLGLEYVLKYRLNRVVS